MKALWGSISCHLNDDLYKLSQNLSLTLNWHNEIRYWNYDNEYYNRDFYHYLRDLRLASTLERKYFSFDVFLVNKSLFSNTPSQFPPWLVSPPPQTNRK